MVLIVGSNLFFTIIPSLNNIKLHYPVLSGPISESSVFVFSEVAVGFTDSDLLISVEEIVPEN